MDLRYTVSGNNIHFEYKDNFIEPSNIQWVEGINLFTQIPQDINENSSDIIKIVSGDNSTCYRKYLILPCDGCIFQIHVIINGYINDFSFSYSHLNDWLSIVENRNILNFKCNANSLNPLLPNEREDEIRIKYNSINDEIRIPVIQEKYIYFIESSINKIDFSSFPINPQTKNIEISSNLIDYSGNIIYDKNTFGETIFTKYKNTFIRPKISLIDPTTIDSYDLSYDSKKYLIFNKKLYSLKTREDSTSLIYYYELDKTLIIHNNFVYIEMKYDNTFKLERIDSKTLKITNFGRITLTDDFNEYIYILRIYHPLMFKVFTDIKISYID